MSKILFPSAKQNKLVAIGTSTGGPKALEHVVTKLPADLPCGVVIVQHMPAGFTKSLAVRLNSLSAVNIKEAEDGDHIKPGNVYIAPGRHHMLVHKDVLGYTISLNENPPVRNLRPSVDVMYKSLVPYGKDIIAVILTGMGNDGSRGAQAIKKAGGYIISEAESTSVVYGMPKAVADLGISDKIAPIDQIADAIINALKRP